MSSYSIPTVFFAGLLSFLSPCVLPLVPGYVSLISGTSVDQLQSADRKLSRTVLVNSLMFILGFSVVFIALGAVATGIGQFMNIYRRQLMQVAGVIIIIFGLHLIGVFKIKALLMDKRLHDVKGSGTAIGAFLIGFAFAFGWTPCIGPILASVLAIAGSQDTVIKGVVLLAVYSAGLAVPFLLTSLGVERFLAFYSRFRRHLHTVEVVSGVFLVLVGALILTRHFTILSSYLSFLNRFSL